MATNRTHIAVRLHRVTSAQFVLVYVSYYDDSFTHGTWKDTILVHIYRFEYTQNGNDEHHTRTSIKFTWIRKM